MRLLKILEKIFNIGAKFKQFDRLQLKDDEQWENNWIIILNVGKNKYQYRHLFPVDRFYSNEQLLVSHPFKSEYFETIERLYDKK